MPRSGPRARPRGLDARRDAVDIFISGGGIAGLVAAASFGASGFSVLLADPAPPPQSPDNPGSDLRSTAFLEPAWQLLDELSLWDLLRPHAAPLEVLRVIDCRGDPPEPRTDRAFRSDDLGAPAFGWNLPNWLTRKVLADALADDPRIDLRFGTGFASLLAREGEALVDLGDGTRLRARLAVAADGRASPLREAARIGVDVTRYGQKALAFTVAHEHAHRNVSTELYLSGGAFTLIPLPDQAGGPASAVVWMNDGPEAVRLAALGADAFAEAATRRSCGVLGNLRLISPRRVFPVVTQTARALTAERVALIAEAAHVLPPIGAQGLNTSLRDVACLRDLARAAPDGLGDRKMLDAYARRRADDMRIRARAIDLYNRVCRSAAPPVQSLRALGLRLTHDVGPVRRSVMRAGLGNTR